MSRYDHMHFSTVQAFQNCPYAYQLRYLDRLDTIPTDDPQNALTVGTAFHRGMETDVETAIREYYMSYPVITEGHVIEAYKLEHWIRRAKEVVPEGLHEVPMGDAWFEGTMDLLVPCTKHDLHLPNGQFDLYDYKYSNNVDHYMESEQLHVYKYFLERITGKRIRKMYFVFIPKVGIKPKKTETWNDFLTRLYAEMEKVDIQIREVPYDTGKVLNFLQDAIRIEHTHEFPKNMTKLCDWCEYRDFCMKGDNSMILPKAERRKPGQTTKRKLWLYGGAFSGKTTFVDQAPMPLNLNTDGNIQFVTQAVFPIKDTFEGRIKVLAWDNFKKAINELETTAGTNGFKTVVVDLLEDTYESCRLYMYDKLGITHESDDSFRAWDKVRTEFLSTIRRLVNLDYENIILISHEDTSKDITKRSGDKITAIKPNIPEKVAHKVAGMVDIVARVVAEEDGTRTLNFKSDEVIFGGGRLHGIRTTQIPLDWDALCKVYDEANGSTETTTVTVTPPTTTETPTTPTETAPKRSRRKKADPAPVPTPAPTPDPVEEPETVTETVPDPGTASVPELVTESDPEPVPFTEDKFYFIASTCNAVKNPSPVPADAYQISEDQFKTIVVMVASGESDNAIRAYLNMSVPTPAPTETTETPKVTTRRTRRKRGEQA